MNHTTKSNPLAVCFATLLTLVFLAPPSYGQTTSTEILGLVTDATGAVVPGAKVTITRVATGETRTAPTNQAGEYSFPLIEIGEYSVRVEAQGFKSQVVTGLRVELQQKARVNFALDVGQVSERIEVSATAVALKTEDASVGQVIENKRIIELPLNGRNMGQLAVLVAGVQYGVRTGMADGTTGFPIPGTGMSIIANGIREIHNTISLDGVDIKNPRVNTANFAPSIEAIEEFKVQTSSYSAEYGMGGGGIVQVSMKSGTNRLHGTLFEFLRNEKLDAESYFLNFELAPGATRLKKDRLRRNQFGLVLSGPVLLPRYNGRNRTFWAFDYEGFRQTKEAVSTAWYPDANFRQGDFSALLKPAINSSTGKPYRSPILVFDALTGVPFPNNIVPATRIHPGAKNLLKYLPDPQFTQEDILDFTNRAAIPTNTNGNQYFWRVDHNFNESDRVFVRFAADRSGIDAYQINPNFPTFTTSQATNWASQWLHMFSPTTLNELRFGLNIAHDHFFNSRSNTDFDIDSLGIGKFRIVGDNNRKLTPVETGFPRLGFTLGDNDVGNGHDYMYTYQFADNLAIIRGKHTFKFGAEYRRIMIDRSAGQNPRGTLTFGANESGYAFASLMLGYPTSSLTPDGQPLTLPRANRWGVYFLDEWKISSRLSINAGLRWDNFPVPVDVGGYWRSLNYTKLYTAPDGGRIPTVLPEAVGPSGAIKLWDQSTRFFMPRLGLAWRPANKWVIRTGAGWFSNPEHMNVFTPLNLMPPLSGSIQFNAVTDVAQVIPVTANNQTYNIQTRKFRAGSPILSFDDPFAGTAQAKPVNVWMIGPRHQTSDHWQWSFDVQRELPFGTAVTVAYVGSKSTHVGNAFWNWNDPDPSPDTNIQARRPVQRFYDDGRVQSLGQVTYLDSNANSNYNGLQVTAEKRFAKGLAFGLAYTFSKSIAEGEAGGNDTGYIQNPRADRRGSRGRLSFDMKHNAVVHFVYEFPFAQNMHSVAAAILKGWQTNGILSLRSGFPFSLRLGDLNVGSTYTAVRPDRLREGNLPADKRTRKLWYDTTAFQRTTCLIPGRLDLCHYGSSGYNFLDAPGQTSLDFSLFKNFPITENIKLQFRSEFFNATNTPFFGVPNSISFTTLDTIIPDGARDGEIRSIRTPMRIIQFGLKVFF